jgi:exodeoxyribonuclease V alpha subunit
MRASIKIMKNDYLKSLESYAVAGAFSPLDLQFALFMAKLAGTQSVELVLAAALVSRQTGMGHICLDLHEAAGKNVAQTTVSCPEFSRWVEVLAQSPVVGTSGNEARPLVLDSAGRLYLYRYWQYEKNLAAFFLKQASAGVACDEKLLASLLNKLFPPEPGAGLNRQKLAAFTAVTRRFSVICGGPGTGKTTTVAKILALLIGLAPAPLRIALAAPTGKAADRVQQAISAAIQGLACDAAVKEALPREASTLHRLLGISPDEARARFDEKNPLPFDVVVVDEASMVDLPLMAKLVRAFPPHARLLLLGDKDQLASVESGAVLGDVCAGGRVETFSRSHLERFESLTGERGEGVTRLEQAPAIADCIVELMRNYRFGEKSSIGALAAAVNRSNSDAALEILASGDRRDLTWDPACGPQSHASAFEKMVLDYYAGISRCADARSALEMFSRFRILCAVREGQRGVAGINDAVEAALEHQHRIRPTGRWYHGRPVMVSRNDYSMRIFNGDNGIIFQSTDGVLKACFAGAGGAVRTFVPARLPEHETAYGLTVHKSQGSEFDEVLIVLPDKPSPVLTRELIYTAITRARSKVTLWAGEEVFKAAVGRCIERTSGLRDALKG